MRFCYSGKDGGDKSKVWGFWLVEIKRLFSVVLLKFEDGTREAYHSHSFNSTSWILRGRLIERFLHDVLPERIHTPTWRPLITRRSDFHKVRSEGTTWVLSFRGPWTDTWREYDPETGWTTTLTHGRKEADA